MNELELNNYLTQQNLFEVFKIQLKKDFESSGCSGDFVNTLTLGYEHIKKEVKFNILNITQLTPSLLPILLYRVDISEGQITVQQRKNPGVDFEELLSELVIKRILQKIILKKSFSV